MRFDPYKLTGLQVQRRGWSWFSFGYSSSSSRKQRSVHSHTDLIVKPAQGTTKADTCFSQVVVNRVEESAENGAEADIPGPVVFDVLADLPPLKRPRCIRELSGLA